MTTAKDQQKYYFFVRQGLVQRMPVEMHGQPAKAWPVARSHEDALRLKKWLEKRCPDRRIAVAMIGSLSGETLEGHIRLAIEDKCVAIVAPVRWSDSGEPEFGSIMLGEHRNG